MKTNYRIFKGKTFLKFLVISFFILCGFGLITKTHAEVGADCQSDNDCDVCNQETCIQLFDSNVKRCGIVVRDANGNITDYIIDPNDPGAESPACENVFVPSGVCTMCVDVRDTNPDQGFECQQTDCPPDGPSNDNPNGDPDPDPSPNPDPDPTPDPSSDPDDPTSGDPCGATAPCPGGDQPTDDPSGDVPPTSTPPPSTVPPLQTLPEGEGDNNPGAETGGIYFQGGGGCSLGSSLSGTGTRGLSTLMVLFGSMLFLRKRVQ